MSGIKKVLFTPGQAVGSSQDNRSLPGGNAVAVSNDVGVEEMSTRQSYKGPPSSMIPRLLSSYWEMYKYSFCPPCQVIQRRSPTSSKSTSARQPRKPGLTKASY